MTNWSEADHPRDEQGKFTDKGGGNGANTGDDNYVLTGGIEKNVYRRSEGKTKIQQLAEMLTAKEKAEREKQERIADILYPTMRDNPKVQAIKAEHEKELREIEKERILGHTKNIGLAALEIGSAFVPGLGEAKIAANITKALVPKVGRAIAKEIATGTTRGAFSGGLSGSVHGLGEGLENDDNLFLSATKGAIEGASSGAIGGAGIGLGAGKATQLYKGIKLKNFKPVDCMTKEERSEFRNFAKKYYQDYLQETYINKKDYGDIYFNRENSAKTAIHNIKLYPDLKKQIKTSKIGKPTNDKNEKDRYYDHLLNNIDDRNLDYIIEVIDNDKKNFKMIKEIKEIKEIEP